MKATILGVTGYTGNLLLHILARHIKVEKIFTASRKMEGMQLSEHSPAYSGAVLAKTHPRILGLQAALQQPADVVFSALPHGISAEVCTAILGKSVLIDLSADFRFTNLTMYESMYGKSALHREFQQKSIYGLTEWYRDAVQKADVIANPGCYPTASLLPLLPFAKAGLLRSTVVINAISGISGAGKKADENLLFTERAENVNAYSPGRKHRHAAEITEQLQLHTCDSTILFTPHLAPVTQGIAVTTIAKMKSTENAAAFLEKAYANEPFIRIVNNQCPETRDVQNTNRIHIGLHTEDKHIILTSVIDNLWKGASGQAVQNMNARFGYAETTGLE